MTKAEKEQMAQLDRQLAYWESDACKKAQQEAAEAIRTKKLTSVVDNFDYQKYQASVYKFERSRRGVHLR